MALPHRPTALQQTDAYAQFDRWVAATVFDILFEVALFIQPLYVVANLQMATKVKVKVISAFAGRLVLLVPLILHLLAIPPFYELTDGRKVSSYNMTRPYIYTQISLALSIVTPTVPMLQPFMQATATTFGMVSGQATNSRGDPRSGYNSHNGRSKQGGGSILAKHVMSSKSFKDRSDSDRNDTELKSHEESNQYSVSAVHNRRVSNSGSDISQQPMIRRDVQYEILYSDRLAS